MRIACLGGGPAGLYFALSMFRTAVGAAALGFARHALDEATHRAMTRRLGPGTLADNPITQTKIAERVLDVDASALLIYRAAGLRDVGGLRNSREIRALRIYEGASEVQKMVIARAHLAGFAA